MKRIQVQNIDASDVLSGAIQIPSDQELAVANLLNNQGTNLVEAWFEGRANAFNTGMTKTRNLAKGISTGQYERVDIDGFTTVHQIDTIGGVDALTTRFARYNFEREAATDWTIAAIVQLGDLGGSANTSLFGAPVGSTGWLNRPALNINGGLALRVFGAPGHTTPILQVFGAVPNIKTQPYRIIVTQSVRNGARCFVDGALAGSADSSDAKAESTGTEVSFLGSDASASSAFYGSVVSCLLMNDDISDNEYALSVVDAYMLSRLS